MKVVTKRGKSPYNWLMRRVAFQATSDISSPLTTLNHMGSNNASRRSVSEQTDTDPVTGLTYFSIGSSLVGGDDVVL